MSFTPVQRPLQYSNLTEFIELYNRTDIQSRAETVSEDNPDGRWKSFTLEEILSRDNTTLTMRWVKDLGLIDFENLASPTELSGQIESDLHEVVSLISSVSAKNL